MFSWLSMNQAASWPSRGKPLNTGVAVNLACELTGSRVRRTVKEHPFSSFPSAPFISPEPIGKGLLTGDGNV